ncbi:hypothetical protein IWX84_001868 [Flavobacterium sp. CG_9.10]|uniref:hypothetical protein n=1 Tax=Flavobacterium sp. CG_9.10 TaxID=2787729 RepID=UPI0018CA0CA5|nr:hypothetical protein [Flavobacterium sp. CG_9.10]MBG6110986.1 hypothetical protein [Flavobacterium sp. CG_9.10]
MPKPESVKQSQTFTLKEVIYNHDGFAIGLGTIFGNSKLVCAMRWNGEDDKAGFPYAFNNPLWLHLPVELTINILIGLLTSKELSKDEYIKILELMKLG